MWDEQDIMEKTLEYSVTKSGFNPLGQTQQNITCGKRTADYGKGRIVYKQGDPADAVYFIKTGKIKIAVLNPDGKEAILAILASGNFFGEASIIGQPLRLHSATVQEPAHLVRFEKDVITEALDLQSRLAHLFIAHLVERNTDLEEGLADRLLNRSEKRLARTLLKLARSGEQESNSIAKIGRFRHEDLAEMVGTTRPRITALMNKFRKLGFIDYKKEITVRADLLMNALLRE